MRYGGEAWRQALHASYAALNAVDYPIRAEQRPQWEALNVRFHEALLNGRPSAWTQKVLRLLSRHSERYRRYAMGLPGLLRDGRLVLPGAHDEATLPLEPLHHPLAD